MQPDFPTSVRVILFLIHILQKALQRLIHILMRLKLNPVILTALDRLEPDLPKLLHHLIHRGHRQLVRRLLDHHHRTRELHARIQILFVVYVDVTLHGAVVVRGSVKATVGRGIKDLEILGLFLGGDERCVFLFAVGFEPGFETAGEEEVCLLGLGTVVQIEERFDLKGTR